MLPSRYTQPKPAQIKRQVSKVKHVSAPLKGLSLSSKLIEGDPLTASVLDNWVVEENQIKCRPGTLTTELGLIAPNPIDQLVPYFGFPNRMAAAGAGKLVMFDNTLLRQGFAGNDWSWTAFTNLSTEDFTVMVNGFDGVWSWDGGVNAPSAPIAVVDISKAPTAVITVGAADIGTVIEASTIHITGATGSWTMVNGYHKATNVNTTAHTFELPGVDTSGALGTAPTGVTVVVQGSVTPEVVTAPPSAPWLAVDQLNIVMAHQNRLWFADSSNLVIYYLPLQQKSGELGIFPLNAIFKRGGSIRAIYTWTTEGGTNVNDQLVIFTSNGEAAVYGGVDPGPDGDFQLAGLFRFDAPLSKHSVINYGGELYVLISTGLVPFSTLMKAESEQLGQSDRNVFSNFFKAALSHRDVYGWSVTLNPTSGRVICNMPQGGKVYSQMVRFMPNPIWATWSALPSRCWGWIDNHLYFGTDNGRLAEMHPRFLNDDGRSIRVDVQAAWQNYGTPAMKHFKMVLPYIQTDGTPKPYVDVKVDYDLSPPTNQPDATEAAEGATWDVATWAITQDEPADGAYWAQSASGRNYWSGVGVIGRVAGPRLVALINNCDFALTGWDVMYEGGSVFG